MIVVNCRSLKNKVYEFDTLIRISQPDVVFGTEYWLDEHISDNEVFPTGYTAYRKDRNTHGGGVFILIRDGIPTVPIQGADNNSESVWCRITFSQGNGLVLGSFYRPPGNSSVLPLFSLSKTISALSSEPIMLAGDFNMPNVEWCNFRPVENSRSTLHSAFFELTRVYDLFQFVQFPTRLGSASDSVLDLLFMNRNNLLKSVVLIPGISDHDVIAATIEWKKIEISRPRSRKVFAYDRGRFDAINFELYTYLPMFIQCCQSNDNEILWGLFEEKLLSLGNIYVPSKIVTANRRGDKPWITKDIRASIKRKARVYRKYCRTRSADLFGKVKA